MKLTIRLDREAHKTLRHHGIERGESVQVIVERLIREFLVREKGRSGAPSRRGRREQ